MSALAGFRALGRNAGAWGSRQLKSRVPAPDLDQRDPDYIREQLPGLWLLASLYFRADVRGLDRIPNDGPVLLVGNHSGGNLPPDTFVFTLAFCSYFGVERRSTNSRTTSSCSTPGLGCCASSARSPPSPSNARAALQSGAALLVYPGGDYEVHRPLVATVSRSISPAVKALCSLALEAERPAGAGRQRRWAGDGPVCLAGETLAKFLRLDRLARLKVLPISLALPWGINVGDFLGHLPLPAKITIDVLDAIDLRAEYGEHPDLDQAYDDVVGRMQEALDELAAERRLPVIG